MNDSETYNGWANRETWAFWLWVTNDKGWYETVREQVQHYLDGAEYDPSFTDDNPPTDWHLGEAVVQYVKETLEELSRDAMGETYTELTIMRDDIGSFWRIDYAEIGAAARELVE